jgi:hypothetical protein
MTNRGHMAEYGHIDFPAREGDPIGRSASQAIALAEVYLNAANSRSSLADDLPFIWQAFTHRTASLGLQAGPGRSEEEPGLPRKSLFEADGDEASSSMGASRRCRNHSLQRLPPIGEYVKSPASHPEDAADWLVVKVKSDDPEGRDELHRLFSRGIRFYLARRLGVLQLDARFQETFTILINAIKAETLNEYKPLIRLVHGIVLKQAAAYRDQDLQNLDEPCRIFRCGSRG